MPERLAREVSTDPRWATASGRFSARRTRDDIRTGTPYFVAYSGGRDAGHSSNAPRGSFFTHYAATVKGEASVNVFERYPITIMFALLIAEIAVLAVLGGS